jgi:hypothetical protein
MSRLQSQGSGAAGSGMNGSGITATAHSSSYAQVRSCRQRGRGPGRLPALRAAARATRISSQIEVLL